MIKYKKNYENNYSMLNSNEKKQIFHQKLVFAIVYITLNFRAFMLLENNSKLNKYSFLI